MSIDQFSLTNYAPDVGASDRAEDIITSQLSFANSALSAMSSYVSTMVDCAIQDIDVPLPAAMAAGLDFDFSRQAFDDILNRKPTAPTLDDILLSFPSAPTITMPLVDTIVLGNLWTAICDKLNNDLADGGYGIDTDDEEAIWQRSKEREKTEYNAQLEEADEVFAGLGYPMPPGALIAVKQKAKQTYHTKLASLNREMTIKRADMYVQARQFAIKTGTEFGSFFAELAKVRAQIYESEIKAAVSQAEIKKDINLAKIEEFRALIEAYTAEIKGVASLYDLASTQQEREIRVQIAVLQANIEVAKAQLEQVIEQARLRLSGTQAAAEVYKAICASALGTIHASASLSGSASINWGYSKSASTAESYSESV